MSFRPLAFAALVLTSSVMLSGQGPPQPQRATPVVILTPGTAFVLGRVVEADSTTAVAGATVRLSGPALGTKDSARFSNGVEGGPRDVVTDAQGDFLFRELPPGAYSISASAAGFVDGAFGAGQPAQGVTTLDAIRSIDVGAGARVADITISLWRKAGLIGTVVDETGDPIVGVSVMISTRIVDWAGAVMQTAWTASTDDRGIYHADLTPGTYVVAVLLPPTTYPASLIDVQAAAQAGGAEMTRAFNEEIRASGAAPPTGAGMRVGPWIVTSRTRQSALAPPSATTPNGLRLYPTTYYPDSATADGATVLSLKSGEERSGINFRLTPRLTHRVSGRLIGTAGAAAHVGIRLVLPDPAALGRMNPPPMADAPEAVTDSTGAFTFLGVPAGAYVLRVFSDAAAGRPMQWATQSVTVGDDDLTNLEVSLRGGPRIFGRVVYQGTATPPPSSPARPLRITPRGAPGSVSGLAGAFISPFVPGSDGTFVTPELVPGSYMLLLENVPSGWTVKSIAAEGRNLFDVPFDVDASDLHDVVITLTDRVSRVTGVVRDATGAPATAAYVGVFPVDKSLWRRPGMPSPRVQTAASGRDGRYTISGIPAGEYYVAAIDKAAPSFADPTVLTKLIPSAVRVSIQDGDVRTADVKLTVLK